MQNLCKVTVDSVEELDPRRVPAPYQFGYAYTISIHNTSPSHLIQILSRRWIVRDGDMKDRIIEGEGVVGKQPVIRPGEKHTYQSFTTLISRYGEMTGKYFGVFSERLGDGEPDDDFSNDVPIDPIDTSDDIHLEGEPFETDIPLFTLIHREIA